MKKLIITCALLSGASIVSFAQTAAPAAAPAQTTTSMQANHPQAPQMTVEQIAERRAKGEEKVLNLTPEQYKAVYNAELEAYKKREALKTSGQASREQFMSLNSSREEQIKKVLTPEQLTKFESMTNRQHPPTPPAPGVPPAPAK